MVVLQDVQSDNVVKAEDIAVEIPDAQRNNGPRRRRH